MEKETATEVRAAHGRGDVREVVGRYRGFHDEGQGGDVEARKAGYGEMVKGYYDLVTDFFAYGWGDSFHFAPRYRSEAFPASIARHQHYLASRLGLAPGMRVLDVGCGIGGPMRSIARFSGATVVGVNNNAYQLSLAKKRNEEAGLADRCEFIEADFMHLPVADGTYDAIYAFEATCHAPDKTALFRELFRVLKPGGQFAAYEWCLTDRYQGSNPEHVRIKKGIEEGDGLPDLWTIPETRAALVDAGFESVELEDRAHASDPETPWFLPLTGKERTFTGIRRTPIGRRVTWAALNVAERLKAVPRG
ncbi:MAG: methyltransferase domain-containing protein, partial [Polyangiaceae bacterium]|nr:methyltransferase domain-containing protein [Polyangiaceae bacterium]